MRFALNFVMQVAFVKLECYYFSSKKKLCGEKRDIPIEQINPKLKSLSLYVFIYLYLSSSTFTYF